MKTAIICLKSRVPGKQKQTNVWLIETTIQVQMQYVETKAFERCTALYRAQGG